MEALLEFIKKLLEDESPADKLKQLAGLVDNVFQLMPSGKHMSGRDLGCLEPTVSLKYRAAGWDHNKLGRRKFKNLNIEF